ncbi:MAG: hypothetical protein Q9160_002105 [Pyrenula sp. 1 TL-2023]
MEQEPHTENLFRTTKRRKFIRKRDEGQIEEQTTATASETVPSSQHEGDDAPNISELLKARKAGKPRWNGVTFSNASTNTLQDATSTPAGSIVRQDTEAARLRAITDRFVPHTGQTVDVDKHMIDYIESEMAKRRLGTPTPDPNTNTYDEDGLDMRKRGDSKPFTQRQPVSIGKIQEIDLGQDAILKNARRTEMAIRKQNGETVIEDDEQPPPKPRKVRLGRDGKPMRLRRGPKRRNSEDVQRDKLVEEVLRETKLEIYDEPSGESSNDNDNELEADERVAEQFKQDFIEAMQSRKRTRTAGQPKPPGGSSTGKAGESVSRGPKLGGSRNARAAMREKELQQQKGKR